MQPLPIRLHGVMLNFLAQGQLYLYHNIDQFHCYNFDFPQHLNRKERKEKENEYSGTKEGK
jgi:hypothetical protein